MQVRIPTLTIIHREYPRRTSTNLRTCTSLSVVWEIERTRERVVRDRNIKRRATTDKGHYTTKKERAGVRPPDFRGLMHRLLAGLERQIIMPVGALSPLMGCVPSDIGSQGTLSVASVLSTSCWTMETVEHKRCPRSYVSQTEEPQNIEMLFTVSSAY